MVIYLPACIKVDDDDPPCRMPCWPYEVDVEEEDNGCCDLDQWYVRTLSFSWLRSLLTICATAPDPSLNSFCSITDTSFFSMSVNAGGKGM